MTVDTLQLTQAPTVKVGMLIRKPPAEVFRAFVDPAITTRFWFTKSSGRVTPGAELLWEWEMYGVSTKVTVKEVDNDRRIRFEWDGEKLPRQPTFPLPADPPCVLSHRREQRDRRQSSQRVLCAVATRVETGA